METSEVIHTVAVMGARGEMGTLFTDRMQKIGIRVLELNRPYTDDNLRALSEADLVIVSVPVPAMKTVIKQALLHLKKGAILADVCSVKTLPLGEMLELYNGPVVGTHPLFGGVIPEDFTPRTAVTPGRDDHAAQKVFDLFKKLEFGPFMTTAEEHDRAVALVQGLNFTTTVSYLAAMRCMDSVKEFITPSLQRRLKSAEKMLTQDKDLFVTLAETNPFSQDAVRQFRNYLQIAAGGDLDLLAERAGWWFDPKRGE